MAESTAVPDLCRKCAMPIGDSCVYIGKHIYHLECSPYHRPAPAPVAEPAVRKLEWTSEPPYSVARVPTLRLLYYTECVWDDGKFLYCILSGGYINQQFATLNEARAAAQADFEARIRSALVPAVAAEPVLWLDEDGDTHVINGGIAIKRLLAELPKPPIGSKLLPLYAVPSSASERERRLVEVLKRARRFIENGIETGHIRMPQSADDPAHETLEVLDAALSDRQE